MDKNITKFLKLFGGTNKIAYSMDRTHMAACLPKAVASMNENGADIYFIVNPSTGFKDKDVSELLVNFVDLDAGRLPNKKYKSDKDVAAFKKKAMAAVKAFHVQPHIIVETRNGYHLYWRTCGEKYSYASREGWKRIQAALLEAFEEVGADKIVSKPNQLMRVPYTLWRKRWSGNNKPFMTKVVRAKVPAKLPTLGELLGALTGKSQKTVKSKAASKKVSANKLQKNEYSYKPKDRWSPQVNSVRLSDDLESGELIAFLNDVNQILYMKNFRYMATQCRNFVSKLSFLEGNEADGEETE